MVVTIGVFDGVHIGHQKILEALKDVASFKRLPGLIFTISHPPEYFSPNFPGLLISTEERVRILSQYSKTVVLDFLQIKDLSPEHFVEKYLPGVSTVVVGKDFKFGKNAEGDASFLKKKGIEVHEVEDVVVGGKRVSSSLIRSLVQEGNVEEIPLYLGRFYEISGIVYKDRQFGKKLGFPTANIDRGREKLVDLRRGIYLVRVHLPSREKKFGVMNVGLRPTVGDSSHIKYEVYILDFEGELYNEYLKVEVIKFLRPEKKFASVKELKNAIEKDVFLARKLVSDIINSNSSKGGGTT
ncbi:riboflavin biosynthesis protein RibF [Thermotoga sp. KOL6]|uniref:riboflavin biosynthesis protein RibF n=1 Tax=Thermotoga sp. KOL6 TaxID=126741 RepID=UPI000C782663|nr:riboflavin biosynthesis protein RibF [Thermotoga sp. KOL6]PLV58338.1 FAD synthetase [Thermotoga sp. KOL6]